MHRPRLITPEAEGWHLIETVLHADRAAWSRADRDAVHATLREWEEYSGARVDSLLVTARSLHLLVKLEPVPDWSDAQILGFMQRWAHGLTLRKAQIALHRGADDPAWRRMREHWHDLRGDISNAIKCISQFLIKRLYGATQPGKLWKDRAYSHPVELVEPVLHRVRVYLAALAVRHGHTGHNSLRSDNLTQLPEAEVQACASGLHRKQRPRHPSGLFGKFSERKVKRQLRRQTRSDAERREQSGAFRLHLARYLKFRAAHGHGRVWESESDLNLLPWLRKINRLHHVGKLAGDTREALIAGGYDFTLPGAPRFRGPRPVLRPLPRTLTS